MKHDCVFCGIISGKVECSKVAEDAHAVAFMDVRPFNAGHVLVVPRRHVAGLVELTEDEAAEVFRLVHRVASALPESGVRCEGCHVSQANGAAAGQEVFHVHFHVVPRFPGDPVRLVVDPARPQYPREELTRVAASIAGVLAGRKREKSRSRKSSN